VIEEKRCIHCTRAFVSKREHGQYCSDTSRVKHHPLLKKDARPRRDCRECGGPLDNMRSDALYCGQKCRTAAWTKEQLRKDPLWGIMSGV
jgi:hypothetical protein